VRNRAARVAGIGGARVLVVDGRRHRPLAAPRRTGPCRGADAATTRGRSAGRGVIGVRDLPRGRVAAIGGADVSVVDGRGGSHLAGSGRAAKAGADALGGRAGSRRVARGVAADAGAVRRLGAEAGGAIGPDRAGLANRQLVSALVALRVTGHVVAVRRARAGGFAAGSRRIADVGVAGFGRRGLAGACPVAVGAVGLGDTGAALIPAAGRRAPVAALAAAVAGAVQSA